MNGHCIEHPTLELVPTRERNHFFRLSRYRRAGCWSSSRSGKFRVEPAIRRNEVVRLLEGGLQDISVSRLRQPWGIPFPGDPEQTVYVWFDALINYLSATGFPDAGIRAPLARRPARDRQGHHPVPLRHLAGDAARAPSSALPREVWAHGYVQWEGTKMSKTAGTAVTLDEAIERHGPDALRYFLLREVGFEADGNFTWERFDERYTADLADGLGNLASRSLAMLAKYRDGVVPRPTGADHAGPGRARGAFGAYATAMDALDLRGGRGGGLGRWSRRPTSSCSRLHPGPGQGGQREAELDVALAALARALSRLAVLASPFIPGKGAELWQMLGLAGGGRTRRVDRPQSSRRWRDVSTSEPEVLFPKPASCLAVSLSTCETI